MFKKSKDLDMKKKIKETLMFSERFTYAKLSERDYFLMLFS